MAISTFSITIARVHDVAISTRMQIITPHKGRKEGTIISCVINSLGTELYRISFVINLQNHHNFDGFLNIPSSFLATKGKLDYYKLPL